MEPVYRNPAPRDQALEIAPRELVYEATFPESRRVASVAAFQIFSVPPAVAAVLSVVLSPEAGLAGLVVASVAAAVWWRRPRKKGFVLGVADGALTVRLNSNGKLVTALPLEDLLDVELETKTIQPMQEGPSPILAVRFTDAQVGPDIDTCRVVLVTKIDAFVPLGETFVARLHATEAIGKIRVFLRRSGWIPQDERDLEAADDRV